MKIVGVLLIIPGLALARMGESLPKCEERYGAPTSRSEKDEEGVMRCEFKKGPVSIHASFWSDQVVFIRYEREGLTRVMGKALLDQNCPGEKWESWEMGGGTSLSSDDYDAHLANGGLAVGVKAAHKEWRIEETPTKVTYFGDGLPGALGSLPEWERKLAATPGDTSLAIRVAALQLWPQDAAGDEKYHHTRARMLKWAEGTKDFESAAGVARLASLASVPEPDLHAEPHALAAKALELAGQDIEQRGWAYLTLGMAAYRAGRVEDALKALATLKKASERTDKIAPHSIATAEFYRVLLLLERAKDRAVYAERIAEAEKAREVFWEAEDRMPGDLKDAFEEFPPTDVKHEDLVLWLAYREAMKKMTIRKPYPLNDPDIGGS